MSAQIIPFPARTSAEPDYVARMQGHAQMIRLLREEERAADLLPDGRPFSALDPEYRVWCHRQNERARESGLPLPHRSELRERWVRGERTGAIPGPLEHEQLIGALKEKLGLRVINTRGARHDKGKITPESYLELTNAVSALAEHFRSTGRAEDAIFRLVRQRFDCRVTDLRESDFPRVMELLAEVRAVVEQLKQSQTVCDR